jgi:hypothetical protein
MTKYIKNNTRHVTVWFTCTRVATEFIRQHFLTLLALGMSVEHV